MATVRGSKRKKNVSQLQVGGENVATQAFVTSRGYLTSETDSQTLSISGTTLSISNGNSVTVPTSIGPQGPQGETGARGPAGATGPQGPQGEQGIQGERGPQGAAGDTGSRGPAGPTGPQGPQGEQGERGPQGAAGATGARGATGPQGPAGDNGADGARGPQGERGPAGAAGATGPQGPKGDTGDRGAVGPTGPAGERGATGARGAAGATGPQGPQGERGPAGVGVAQTLSWNSSNGNLSISSGNNVNFDNRYYTESEVNDLITAHTPWQTFSDFTNGTLVRTNIVASNQHGDSFILKVTGKSYSSTHSPFDLILQGYIYNNTFINNSGIANSTSGVGAIKILELDGYLCFWWARFSYWNSFEIYVTAVNSTSTSPENRVTGVEDVVEPDSTLGKKVSVTPYESWTSREFSQGAISNWNTAYSWGDHEGLYAAASHNHTSLNLTGRIYNGSDTNSIDLVDHGSRTWLRNQQGAWTFQAGSSGDDWTQSYTLYLPSAGSTRNNVWAELGQRDSNDSGGGRYRGLRIVKDTGNSVDGDLRAGDFYSGTTRVISGGQWVGDPTGLTGPQGPQGERGATGAVGPQGPQGETGARGPAGSNGSTGPQGPQGEQGERGPQGAAGAAGARGPAGAAGATGPQGPKGDTGDRGPAGAAGARGAVGPQGPQGERGPQGPAGADGDDGATGARGPVGPQGPQGERGATGPAGSNGRDGAVGPQGPAGPQGERGATGSRGPAGATGPQGPAGRDGSNASISFINEEGGGTTSVTSITFSRGEARFTMADGSTMTIGNARMG